MPRFPIFLAQSLVFIWKTQAQNSISGKFIWSICRNRVQFLSLRLVSHDNFGKTLSPDKQTAWALLVSDICQAIFMGIVIMGSSFAPWVLSTRDWCQKALFDGLFVPKKQSFTCYCTNLDYGHFMGIVQYLCLTSHAMQYQNFVEILRVSSCHSSSNGKNRFKCSYDTQSGRIEIALFWNWF